MNEMEKLRDPRFYAEHFLTIRTKRGRLQKLRLNRAQRRLYDIMREEHDAGRPVRIVILKARQLGLSTAIEADFFHDAATRPLVRTLIVAHDEGAAGNLFRMNKLFYDRLPAALKPMRKHSNAREIMFENPTKDPEEKARSPGLMSAIRCVPATGAGVGRSDTLTNVHASEAAFWHNMNETLDALLQAVPDDPDTAVIVETTPNGFNAFKDFWDAAVEGRSAFRPVFFPWFEEPEYRARVPSGTVWTEEEERLRAAYGLDDEQLAWRRWCIANNLRGDAEKFRQEYPSSPEEAFLLSGRPFFNNEVLLARLETAPEPVARGRFVYGEAEDYRPLDARWEEDGAGEIALYERPRPGVPYVFGGDTAGDGSDRFTAFGLDNATGNQAAQLVYGGGSELWYAQQLYCLGLYYNAALLGVEVNFSTYPERKLEEWGYPRLYIRERTDDASRALAENRLGWRTDLRTRPLMLANLRTVAEQTPDMLCAKPLLREMLTFVRNADMRPEAAPDAHDDMVMAAAVAHQIRPQQSYEAAPETPEAREKLIDRLAPRRRGRKRS